MIEQYIDEICKRKQNKTISIRQIAEKISERAGVSVKDVLSPTRRAEIVCVRHLICFVAKQKGFTLSQIARAMNRDHTSVINSIKRAEDEWAKLRR